MSLTQCLELQSQYTMTKLLDFPFEKRDAYSWWLSQTYHFVSHTTRLLCLAAGMSRLEDEGLFKQYLFHLKEESGHEKIALDDIKKVSGTLYEEHPDTRNFYSSVKSKILKNGPSGLLGYMIFLEYLSIYSGTQLKERLLKTYGKHQIKFIKVHAEEDVEHVDMTLRTLEQIGLDLKKLEADIVEFATGYNRILDTGLAMFNNASKGGLPSAA